LTRFRCRGAALGRAGSAILRRGVRASSRALLIVLLFAPTAAGAQQPAAPPGGKGDLDRLLKLPDSLDYGYEKRGGASRSEWRARFAEARQSLASAESALARAQQELADEGGKSDAWNVAPPGLPAAASNEGTEAFQLREEVRRQRAEVERARLRLRELEVEANLAGVPEEWRGPRTETSPDHETVPRADGRP
jgi:hypothetical protein